MFNFNVKVQAVYFEKLELALHLWLFGASGRDIFISEYSEPTAQKILDLINSTEKSNNALNKHSETLVLYQTTVLKCIQIGHHSTQGWCSVMFN